MNSIGSTALARVAGTEPVWTSKCRCGPEELPEVPTKPITLPAAIRWPTTTWGLRTRWQ